MQCTVCGGSARRPFLESREYCIAECLRCTHAYVEAMPTAAELEELYSDTAESFLGSGLAGPMAAYLGDDEQRFFSFYADRLDALEGAGVGRSGRILDFGCAQGAFVETLHRKGFTDVTGFDLSAAAVAEGIARWNLVLVSGDFDEFVAKNEGSFDLVHAANVLEHVPEPTALLRQLRRLLAPHGELVVSVPNARSLQVKVMKTRSPVIDPPHHLQYYGPNSLERLVYESGFTVSRVQTLFWLPATDLYLQMKGVPLWLGGLVRHAMSLPGFVVNWKRLGGVIELIAVRSADAV